MRNLRDAPNVSDTKSNDQRSPGRKATGMGVRDLADKAGVAVSSVSRFEAGGNTTVTNLDKMKSALVDAGAVLDDRDGLLWVGVNPDQS